jgi:hypothetical protein
VCSSIDSLIMSTLLLLSYPIRVLFYSDDHRTYPTGIGFVYVNPADTAFFVSVLLAAELPDPVELPSRRYGQICDHEIFVYLIISACS